VNCGAGLEAAIEGIRDFDGCLHALTIKPYLWLVKARREVNW
jgi:hypothetical protein